jgi:hypothetical protein
MSLKGTFTLARRQARAVEAAVVQQASSNSSQMHDFLDSLSLASSDYH